MTKSPNRDLDAVIIGAGFSGLYMLHRLRELGLSAKIYDTATGVGGAWYWNRYPGACCDSPSIDYCYSFSDEIAHEWNWSRRFPRQPEIEKYLNFVADKLELRKDINFSTRISSAHYDEAEARWNITTADGDTVSSKYFIPAVGALSVTNLPDIPGLDTFKGESFHTARWPREKVDFKGKRVGVIGTGSTGVQVMPEIAKEADEVVIFQRTPQYVIPAGDFLYTEDYLEMSKVTHRTRREHLENTDSGFAALTTGKSALDEDPATREKTFEAGWQQGAFGISSAYSDILVDEEANKLLSDFVRTKIAKLVDDPETAKAVTPDYYIGTKRQIQSDNYYLALNRPNVSVVDLRRTPIEKVTPEGIKTTSEMHDLDVIVYATGFDAITGALLNFDVRGVGGVSLGEKWKNGSDVNSYLGVLHSGFPNMFSHMGPLNPDYFSNAAVPVQRRVEWVADLIEHVEKKGIETVDVDAEIEEEWSTGVKTFAAQLLYLKTDSWYTGANIPGKPRNFLVYVAGVDAYLGELKKAADDGYESLLLSASESRDDLVTQGA